MLVAVDKNNKRNISWITEKSQRPFYCPTCKDEVILKKGKIREDHFAHKPFVDCIYAGGESQKHYKAKRIIYTALNNYRGCTKCDIERQLDGVRPDVSLCIGKTYVAIEIQKSNIDIDEICRRTSQYTKLGIHILWIIPDTMPNNISYIEDQRLQVWRPMEWQKYIHAMYFGRLYFWQYGAVVKPIHLNEYKYYKEAGNWVEDFYENEGVDLEGTCWHDENHPEAEYGGYWKTSKTKKVLSIGQPVHIVEAFTGILRPSFKSKNWSIPISKVWIDNQEKWW